MTGREFKLIRTYYKIKPREIYLKYGCTRQNLSLHENSDKQMPAEMVMILSEILNVYMEGEKGLNVLLEEIPADYKAYYVNKQLNKDTYKEFF